MLCSVGFEYGLAADRLDPADMRRGEVGGDEQGLVVDAALDDALAGGESLREVIACAQVELRMGYFECMVEGIADKRISFSAVYNGSVIQNDGTLRITQSFIHLLLNNNYSNGICRI